jgi:hypothetical protein
MTDLETRLDQALKADVPPARDPMFRIRVMERRTRDVLRRRLVACSALAFGAAILGALGAGVLQTLPGTNWLGAAAAAAVVGALLLALLVAPYLGGRAVLNDLVARASWTLSSLPRMRLWP